MATLHRARSRIARQWIGRADARAAVIASVSLLYALALGLDGLTLLTPPSLASDRTTWPLLLLSPWFFLLGTLLVVRASPPRVGRAAYTLFVAAAYALALAPAADSHEPLAVGGEMVAVPLFAVAFAHFFLVFPTPREAPRLRALLPAPALGAVALGLAALIWPEFDTIGSFPRLTILLTYLLLGAGFLVHAWIAGHDPDTRQGLTIIGAGAVVSILPFALLYLLPTLLRRPPPLAAEQTIMALALLPASFAYAILRHNVLHMSLVQRWLVHGLLWGGLLLLYAVVVYALRGLLSAAFPALDRGVALAVVLVPLAGLSFQWLHDTLWRPLDCLVFKDAYEYRTALQGLSRDLSLVEDLDTLADALPRRLQRLMNLEFVVLLVEDARGASTIRGTDGACQLARTPELAETARAIREEPRVVYRADGESATLIVPLRTHDRLVGRLCLGRKRSGEPFRPEDRALLATLSGQLAALVRNGQLVDELRGQVDLLQAQKATLDTLNERLQHAQEEERARLAADLHDEALQTALHLRRRLIADGRGRETTDGHVAVAEAVIDQLRLVCTTVRPPALDELGLAAALETLALDLGTDLTVPILFDADPALADLALAPAVELVLYRAAQEALNNALRHARPSMIRMSLRCEDGAIQLFVCDDGDGFVASERLDKLAAKGHLGLFGLQRRVGHAGGRLSVTSEPGQGTVVRVAIAVTGAKGVPQ